MFIWGLQIPMLGVSGVPFYIFLIIPISFIHGFYKKAISSGTKLFMFLLLIFLAQKFVFNTPVISTNKTLFTILMISYLFIAICSFFESIRSNKREIVFYSYLRTFLYLQLSVMLIQFLMFFLGLHSNGKFFYSYLYQHMFFDFLPRVSGLFQEPSHLAMGLAPIYFILIQKDNNIIKYFRWYDKYTIILIAFLCPSSTLFLAITFSYLLKIFQKSSTKKIKQFLYYFILSPILIFFLVIEIDYLNDRVFAFFDYYNEGPEGGALNISSLILIKGFQMTKHALTFYPFGVGINNMPILNDFSIISKSFEILKDAHSNDGGSFAFKVSSELGYLGLVFYIYSTFRLFNLIKSRREYFSQIFIFALLINSFRGGSYFDGSIIVGLSLQFQYLLKYYSKYFQFIKFRNYNGPSTKHLLD